MVGSNFHSRSARTVFLDRWASLPLQVTIFGALLGVAAMAPPERGTMLLLPLRATQGEVANLALAHGAALLGAGRLPGSLVVSGNRDAMLRPMLRHGILITAAVPLTCGSPADRTEGQP